MAAEQSSSTFGVVAPVESVQELIKELPDRPEVPQPFILDDPQPQILSAATSVSFLPTIDMKQLMRSETIDSELEKLHSTCKQWGFFQVHFLSLSIVFNHFSVFSSNNN